MRSSRNIMIVHAGSLGDLLLFTGALRVLREHFPEDRIMVACRQEYVDLIRPLPWVSGCLPIPTDWQRTGWFARVRRWWMRHNIISRNYDRIIHASYMADDYAHGICRAMRGGKKFWYEVPSAPDTGWYDVRVKVDERAHELDKYAALVTAVCGGGPVGRDAVRPDLCLTPEERREGRGSVERGTWKVKCAQHMEGERPREPSGSLTGWTGQGREMDGTGDLTQPPAPRGYGAPERLRSFDRTSQTRPESNARNVAPEEVGMGDGSVEGGTHASLRSYAGQALNVEGGRAWRVAVCAGARFAQKDWGVDNFVQLIRQLAVKGPLQVVLLGGPEDRERHAYIRKGLSGCVAVEDFAGKLTPRESAAVIGACDLCVGNDTFGLHAAIAVGTPSVVIMGGGDYPEWVPWGDPDRHRMVVHVMDCFQCRWVCRYGDNRCVRKIGVEEVVEACRRGLGSVERGK